MDKMKLFCPPDSLQMQAMQQNTTLALTFAVSLEWNPPEAQQAVPFFSMNSFSTSQKDGAALMWICSARDEDATLCLMDDCESLLEAGSTRPMVPACGSGEKTSGDQDIAVPNLAWP